MEIVTADQSSPQPLNRKTIQLLIRADHRYIQTDSLRCNHPVKRVFMRRRHSPRTQRIFYRYRQLLKAGTSEDCYKILLQLSGNRQPAISYFGRYLPRAGS